MGPLLTCSQTPNDGSEKYEGVQARFAVKAKWIALCIGAEHKSRQVYSSSK